MKTQITIQGRNYTVRSDEDDIDLQAIARYVDGKIEEIGGKSSTVDGYTVAMLAALNIASDYERFRRAVDGQLSDLDRELASTMVLLEGSLPSSEGSDGEDADGAS